MNRALPWSLALHVLFLGLLALVGGSVTPPPASGRPAIRVRLGGPPGGAPGAAARPPAVRPSTRAAQAGDPAPPKPEAGARKVPRAAKTEPVPSTRKGLAPDTKPDPKRKPARDEEAPAGRLGGRPGGTGAAGGPGVGAAGGPGATAGGTDQDFPFAWYLSLVEGRISRNWSPAQLGFGAQAERSCVVHFTIRRDGRVADLAVVESSGIDLFDREAVRAVQASAPLPSLPAGFGADRLGISFVFTLRSQL